MPIFSIKRRVAVAANQGSAALMTGTDRTTENGSRNKGA